MAKRTAAKFQKELKRRYGKLAESMEPYYHHLDLRPLQDLDDDAFAFIMAKVKGVNMLDISEASITHKSIKLLTGLEYVNELRIKECAEIDDGCLEFLDQLITLTFLQLKSTGVTIDGLLQLTNLTNLKELLFSAPDSGNINKKMLQLKSRLTGCSFTVNSKPWIFDESNPLEDVS